MVLGLDRGGVCEGIAYRIAAQHVEQTRTYLRARELINGVYREVFVPAELEGEPRTEVLALAFIVERAHPNYAGRLPLATQARLIKAAKGISGANIDYLVSTVRHLRELGIHEPELERVVTLIGPLAWHRAQAQHTSPYGAAMVRAQALHPPPVGRLARKDERRRFLYRLWLDG
jgi:cation transport protein ChaC